MNYKRNKLHTRWVVSILSVSLLLLTLFSGCAPAISKSQDSYENSENLIISGSSEENTESQGSSREELSESISTMEIHFLDVGQGLSILAKSEDEVLIYDGGDRNHSDFVVSYLKTQGIDKIDYLISSHYDSDHLSGLIGCLYAFEIETIIAANYEHNSSLYNSFHNAVAEKGLTITYPQAGDTFEFGSGSFTILSPSTTYNDSNNNSVTLKLSNGNDHFLFMGDAEQDSETDIVNSGLDLSCDVLCAGHHGSASSTSWDLLQASVPEYAVISCGIANSHGHPHEETMEKLYSMEIPVFRTDLQGSMIATSNGTSITWNVDPCNNYASGNNTSPTDIHSQSDQTVLPEVTFILNIRSKVFHSPDCENIETMSKKNKQNFFNTRDEIIEMGYKPCGNCEP